MIADSRGHLPDSKWEFDTAVTTCFDDMLERSIPQYAEMRRLCHVLASHYAQRDTAIVDLGCSRGEAMAELVRDLGCYNRFVGVEISQPMLAAARERFAGYISAGVVDIRDTDLRYSYPAEMASVTLSVLTLQFVPIEHRQRVVHDAYQYTTNGGVLILVEKILGDTATLDALMVAEYLAMKARNGYSSDEIERKRLSLEGVLVPLTAEWNERLLERAGFRQVDCFWRWMNFAGWVAVK